MDLFQVGKIFLTHYPSLTKISSIAYNIVCLNFKKIKGEGNEIYYNRTFLNKCQIKIIGNNNKIILGNKCYLKKCKITIDGDNNVIKLNDMVFVNNTEFYMEDNNNLIEVGNSTVINGPTHLACIEGTSISIGKNCLFSSNVTFRTGDSHSILNLNGERVNPSKNIQIKNHVWLGNKATITKGAEISENSIVGTGAVVTRSFKDSNVILAGVPAKIIKKNINWDVQRL